MRELLEIFAGILAVLQYRGGPIHYRKLGPSSWHKVGCSLARPARACVWPTPPPLASSCANFSKSPYEAELEGNSGQKTRVEMWLLMPAADADLPSVVFIERAGNTYLDEHPGNNIQTGAALAAQIINALMASPAWRSSAFIFSYDEFGGWYDHVPAFQEVAPDNIAPLETIPTIPLLPGDFAHSGFRVPFVLFSPWVKPHFVSHVPRDHTSILKLIETRFGLPALTARDAAADDMTEFFDSSKPYWATPPTLPSQPVNGVCDLTKELAVRSSSFE